MSHTEIELQVARVAAAQIEHDIAHAAINDPLYGFASHVTQAEKVEYAERHKQYAVDIEAGLCDNNFTVWQRMNYHLTGEMIALLPK